MIRYKLLGAVKIVVGILLVAGFGLSIGLACAAVLYWEPVYVAVGLLGTMVFAAAKYKLLAWFAARPGYEQSQFRRNMRYADELRTSEFQPVGQAIN